MFVGTACQATVRPIAPAWKTEPETALEVRNPHRSCPRESNPGLFHVSATARAHSGIQDSATSLRFRTWSVPAETETRIVAENTE
jgi:hypothetical protein